MAMMRDERRAAILSELDRTGSVKVSELADLLSASTVTVRSDLVALEHDGKLRRTHGGAVSLSRTLTVSVQDRRVNVNVGAKAAVGRAAAGLVADGESLLVDSGTTALEFVRNLAGKRGITVVTADLTIADYIDRSLPDVDVVLLGGSLRKGHRYLYGPLVISALEALHPDKAVVCPTSFVPGRGFMTNYEQMAEVKRAFMRCAEKTYVLMDATKVGASGLMWFGAPDSVDAIVMDDDPDGVVAAEVEELPCELVLAG